MKWKNKFISVGAGGKNFEVTCDRNEIKCHNHECFKVVYGFAPWPPPPHQCCLDETYTSHTVNIDCVDIRVGEWGRELGYKVEWGLHQNKSMI
jgi:hypothetical protein